MRLEPDDVLVYADAWGLRRLFSLALRRRSASRKKRDDINECLFQTLLFHWGPTKQRKGAKGQTSEDVDKEIEKDIQDCLDAEMVEGDGLDGVTLVRAETDDYMMLGSGESPGGKADAQPAFVAENQDGDCWEDLDAEELRVLEEIALLKLLV